ncbi:MAG: AAA family ATPase [Deltaproteobacteria bacterium]|nr:AAA family ATPase [Deltaproteobacteria bacterium]
MNPLQSIVINAFGPFKRLKVSFCSGINVLVGANSTGKSWLMKLLYGALRASKDEGMAPDRLAPQAAPCDDCIAPMRVGLGAS